jgi:hypothetical protein
VTVKRRGDTFEAADVVGPDQIVAKLVVGDRLTFGRGHRVDLRISGDPRLSREAGELAAFGGGVWVFNSSRTHALYVEGEGYRFRLPPLTGTGPRTGAVLVDGSADVGSAPMIARRLALRVTVHSTPSHEGTPVHLEQELPEEVEATARSLDLDRGTKLFLVAFVLCRGWLEDPSRTAPLPTAPQLAKSILHLVDARRQLEVFDRDRAFRDHMAEQVTEHLKYLRKKILSSALVVEGTRLTPAVMADVLLANDVVTRADLALLDSPAWRSVQENLWWGTRR